MYPYNDSLSGANLREPQPGEVKRRLNYYQDKIREFSKVRERPGFMAALHCFYDIAVAYAWDKELGEILKRYRHQALLELSSSNCDPLERTHLVYRLFDSDEENYLEARFTLYTFLREKGLLN